MALKRVPSWLSSFRYNHFGGIDIFQDNLYISTERKDKSVAPQIILVDKYTGEFRGSGQLRHIDRSIPWCAINPLNGLLFASQFNITEQSQLYVYRPVFDGDGILDYFQYLSGFNLYDENGSLLVLESIQGATFTLNGHFYLSSNSSSGGRGIHGFHATTGKREIFLPIIIDEEKFGGMNEELEDVTIKFVNNGWCPGIPQSQIHLAMIGNINCPNDNLWIKH